MKTNLLFISIILFFVGYWLVSWIYTKCKIPSFQDDNKSNKDYDETSYNQSYDSKSGDEGKHSGTDNSYGSDHNNARDQHTYFSELLDIDNDYTIDNIKQKYRDSLRKYHPDKVSHLGSEFQVIAEQKTKEINKAYDYFKKIYNFN